MRTAKTTQLASCLAILVGGANCNAEILEDIDATLTLIEATGPSDASPDPATGLFCRRADDALGSTEIFPLRVELAGNTLTLSFLDDPNNPEPWFAMPSTNIGTQTVTGDDGMPLVIHRRYLAGSVTDVSSPVAGYTSSITETIKGIYRTDFFPSFQTTLTEHSTTTLNSNGDSVECTEKYTLRGGGAEVDIAPDDSGWIEDAAGILRDWVIDEDESRNYRRLTKTASIGVRG